MFSHHQETIEIITEKFKKQEDVLGLLIGGSVAHGFATEKSDVDIFIVVSNKEYNDRLKDGNLTYWEEDSCTYEGGYVDGKYICTEFLEKVAKDGSEPARFAFKDSFIVYSKIDNLNQLLKDVTRYPIEEKEAKIEKFYAQFEAWKWYCYEALKHNNSYLLHYAIPNYVLFAGRLILVYNETLYPYHKWFLKELESVKNKPDRIIEQINLVLEEKNEEEIEKLYKMITEFTDWGHEWHKWPNRFMLDSELTWMSGKIPVTDL